MMFFWPIALIALLLVAVFAGRSGTPISWGCMPMAHGDAGHLGTAAGPAAVDLLKGRYARGEIDREEYRQKLSDLS
jgi:uncharacterized membrane protein